MKSILLSLVMFFNTNLTPEEKTFPASLYGIWQSVDNEFLRIVTTFDLQIKFLRVKDGKVLASGNLRPVEGGIGVYRTDIDAEYTLSYTLNNRTVVIEKPDSHRVWVFTKVGH